MHKIWFDVRTDPDSDFQNEYLYKVMDFLNQYAASHDRFTYLRKETSRDYVEIDSFELCFPKSEDATQFKLVWPFNQSMLEENH